MRKLLPFLLALMMLFSAASAENITTIYVDQTQTVFCNEDGIRLVLDDAHGQVKLTLSRDDILLLEQNCGVFNGEFSSQPIYLDSNGEYQLCLMVEDNLYMVTVIVDRAPAPTEIGWL